jgi:hypothetical protein
LLKALKKQGGYSTQERNFLKSMSVFVYSALTDAIKTDSVKYQINILHEPAARDMSYAIVDDLVSNIYELIHLADINSKQENDRTSNDICKIAVAYTFD